VIITPRSLEVRHFHLFAGLGGGARGFNRGQARVGHLQAEFRCIGGVDVDAAAIRDFGRLAGVPGTVLDMFDVEQYRAWHRAEPPATWREATPDDLRAAVGGESGGGARPFAVEWARSAVAQCREAGVPVFVKQLGALPITTEADAWDWGRIDYTQGGDGTCYIRLADRKGGDPGAWPLDLRVQEFPVTNG
jgi:hypothetical protein